MTVAAHERWAPRAWISFGWGALLDQQRRARVAQVEEPQSESWPESFTAGFQDALLEGRPCIGLPACVEKRELLLRRLLQMSGQPFQGPQQFE